MSRVILVLRFFLNMYVQPHVDFGMNILGGDITSGVALVSLLPIVLDF